MAIPTQAALHARVGIDLDAGAESARTASAADFDLSVHEDMSAAEADWRAFEERADLTVFQTFDWLSTWHRHIGARNGVIPAIVMVRQRGEIVSIWPLAIESRSRARCVRWLGARLSNYNGPLLAADFSARIGAEAFAALWRAVKLKFRREFGADLFDLDKMPERIGKQPNPFLQFPVTPYHTGAYWMRLGTDWEAFYAEKRSIKTRKTERKKRNRLAEFGDVQFVTETETSEIERTLDVMIRQKTRSYAALGVANVFDPPGHRDFFMAVATGAGSRRLVHVSRLNAGSLVTAANFGLVVRGRYYYVVASYDDGEVARYGPGNAHLHDLMKYSMEQGLGEFDFTIGDEPYKRDWYDSETRMVDLIAPVSLRGHLVSAPAKAIRHLKRLLARNPKIWALVRKARSTIGALRRRGDAVAQA